MESTPTDRTTRILIIEDDLGFAERLGRNLELEGFDFELANGGEEGLKKLRRQFFDLAITDIRMPGLSGMDLLRMIRAGSIEGVDTEMPVVALSSVNTAETAVEAMKLGAADYITKETSRREIFERLRRALEKSRLINENRMLRAQLEDREGLTDFIGQSEAIQSVKQQIQDVADSDALVLITGETGVGKELVAKAVHTSSPRAGGPFLDVNCAALPDENFFQSELFGHERGAFTGAVSMRRGRFELASGGTLFLDEIAELSHESQGKMLKAIEQRQITRLGGARPIHVDCRILCATNRDLKKRVEDGLFREDLYYRVNVIPLQVPPLRERPDDIPVLMAYFLKHFANLHRRPLRRLTEPSRERIQEYAWPGNVRELRNVAERLTLMGTGEIDLMGLGRCGLGGQSPESVQAFLPSEGVDLEEVERQYVMAALRRSNWNQKEAARLLKISVDRMNARVKKFNIRHPAWRTNR